MKKGWLITAGVLAIAAGGCAYGYNAYLKTPLEAVRTIRGFAEETMSLDVEGKLAAEDEFSVNAEVYRAPFEGHDVYTVSLSQVNLYGTDGNLILPSGKVWKIGTYSLPDVNEYLLAYELASKTDVSYDAETGMYTLESSGEDLSDLLKTMKISLPEDAGTAQSVTVQVNADTVEFLGVTDTKSLYAKAVKTEKTAPELPSAVQTAILEGTEGQDLFSEENKALFRSVLKLVTKETISADVNVNADLGMIQVNNNFGYARKVVDGTPITVTEAAGITLYHGNNVTCLATGALYESQDSGADTSQMIAGVGLSLFLNGDFECTQSDDAYCYRMKVGEDVLKDLVNNLLPQSQELSISFKEGVFELQTADDELTSVSLKGSGKVKVIIVDVDVSLGVTMTMNDKTVEIPVSVVNTINK